MPPKKSRKRKHQSLPASLTDQNISFKYSTGDTYSCLYNKGSHQPTCYPAKILDTRYNNKTEHKEYKIHYVGWNKRFDGWLRESYVNVEVGDVERVLAGGDTASDADKVEGVESKKMKTDKNEHKQSKKKEVEEPLNDTTDTVDMEVAKIETATEPVELKNSKSTTKSTKRNQKSSSPIKKNQLTEDPEIMFSVSLPKSPRRPAAAGKSPLNPNTSSKKIKSSFDDKVEDMKDEAVASKKENLDRNRNFGQIGSGNGLKDGMNVFKDQLRPLIDTILYERKVYHSDLFNKKYYKGVAVMSHGHPSIIEYNNKALDMIGNMNQRSELFKMYIIIQPDERTGFIETWEFTSSIRAENDKMNNYSSAISNLKKLCNSFLNENVEKAYKIHVSKEDGSKDHTDFEKEYWYKKLTDIEKQAPAGGLGDVRRAYLEDVIYFNTTEIRVAVTYNYK